MNLGTSNIVAKRRVLVLWTHISGYMCENWRKLGAHEAIELKGIAWKTDLSRDHVSFADDTANSLHFEIVQPDQHNLSRLIAKSIAEFQPEVILVAGWGVSAYRSAVRRLPKGSARVVMGMDTPWQGRWMQRIARFALRPFLSRIDAVLAAGDRSAEYAKRLGFSDHRIYRGLYSWDENLRTKCKALHKPKQNEFLLVGRYVPEKGLNTLVSAYRKYRSQVSDPWDLVCCGSGPLKPLLQGEPGIRDMGFIAPSTLPEYFARAKVFVLPSHFEPWGVAIAEAMGCGLPVIVSDECGAAADLIEPGISGFVVKAKSTDELLECMLACHAHPEKLTEMGQLASNSADRFTSAQWANRFQSIVATLLADR